MMTPDQAVVADLLEQLQALALRSAQLRAAVVALEVKIAELEQQKESQS